MHYKLFPMDLLPILLSAVALVFGTLLGYLVALRAIGNSKSWYNEEQVKADFVPRELHQILVNQAASDQSRIQALEQHTRTLELKVQEANIHLAHSVEKEQHRQEELAQIQQQFRLEFARLGEQLFHEKGAQLSKQHHEQLQHLLHPLKENLQKFELGIQQRFVDDTRDKEALRKEIEMLRSLNVQLSQDAQQLVKALRSDNKTQGNWGELQLEIILEKAGLSKNTHYQTQVALKNEDGQQLRPDVVVFLPEKKHIVIDSKVSLLAFEQFVAQEEQSNNTEALKLHLDSIRQHIRGLSSKTYHTLEGLDSPDYVLLFIPIEPAFTVAIKHDPQLFTDALDKNIVLVSPTTLLATLRTIAYLWRQEKQKQHVLEIARQSGLLYDKFVHFVQDLRDVGTKLQHAQKSWDQAMNKLSQGARPGDTLIGKAEKLKALGARHSKNLPDDLLLKSDASETEAVTGLQDQLD